VRAVILLNQAAGGVTRTDAAELRARITVACAIHNIDARVELCDPASLPRRARFASQDRCPPDIIVAAGGDGTVSSVAGAVLDSGIPLGVLPLGTLNHFARDLGLPTELEASIGVIAQGVLRQIDVGKVNGRLFINNSVIGLYPALVVDRDRQRARRGRAKWLAHVLAALRLLGRFPRLTLGITIDGVRRQLVTSLVFIGNNPYRISLPGLGRRTRLDSGALAVYVVKRRGWWGVLGLLLRLAFGRLDQTDDFEMHSATELTITAKRRRLRVALDGEVLKLPPPLIYCPLPQALTVVVPTP
jgi:diacylglycerol kinase family enzyme